MVDNSFPELTAQVAGFTAHGLDGVVQLVCGQVSGVGHVLCQKVLKSLTDGIALGHDALSTLVSGAAAKKLEGYTIATGLCTCRNYEISK